MRSVSIAILIAGVLSMAALVAGPNANPVANLRLDDHETSWPDHEGVQSEAVTRLATDGVRARARPDRSTVEATGDELAELEGAIERLVRDDGDPASINSVLDAARSDLQRADDEVESAMTEEVPADRIIDLANIAVDQRSATADLQIAAESLRSRFVAMGPSDAPEPSPVQWVLAIGLILCGAVARLQVTLR